MLQCLAYLFYFQTIILVIVWRYKKGILFTRFAPGTRPESPSPILAARYTPIEGTLAVPWLYQYKSTNTDAASNADAERLSRLPSNARSKRAWGQTVNRFSYR